jgi:glycosyltransferase involved in cell wall biosynthesis
MGENGAGRHRAATVIIPLLAQENSWLAEAVLSALGQNAQPEVIVVVSRKTPASNLRLLERLSRRHPRLRLIPDAPRSGFASALNRGIEAASTERVGFLLSDDWLEPGAVQTCLRYGADIVSTGLTIYDATGRRQLLQRRLCMAEYQALPTLESRAYYLKHFFLFRRQKLLDLGGVDESVGVTGPDDYDLIWTLLEHDATVAIASQPLYGYRDHCGQRLTLRPREEQIRDLERILDKHGVHGLERDRIVRERSMWYGCPYHVRSRTDGAASPERARPSQNGSGRNSQWRFSCG